MPSITKETAKPTRLSYTVKDAAFAISLSRSKIYELMKGCAAEQAGGGRRLIPHEALQGLLDGATQRGERKLYKNGSGA
jgi:hypothetical protein